MANFNNIKNEIDQNVNTNGVQAITGAILNETLKDMIDEVDEKKQDTLVAGQNITIQGNVISATGGSGQSYTAGEGIDIDPNNVISVDASDLAGDGLDVDPNGKLAIDPTEVQEKLTAGDHIYIYDNIISATGLQEHLVSGQNIKTVNGNSLLGSGDIVISGGGGGNYLPLEGGTLQNTAPGEDTELKVIDGMDEDYVKIVAPESAGEKPHVEIFENGSGDTKIYYDHIERGSQVSIDLPSSSGTLALTTDIPEAGSGLIENASGEFEVDTTAIQEKLVAGQNITIQGNTISASGQGYMAGTGIDITGNTISVDNTVATQNDLYGKQDTLTAGTGISIQNNVISATGGSGGSYTAGNGIDITGNTISVDATDLDGTGLTTNQNGELEVDTNVIQGKLTAGSGIYISSNNVISATGGSGSGLWVSGTGTDSIISPGGVNSILSPIPSEANGQGAISMGLGTIANGDFSVAMGNTCSATGDGSVAINGTTYANEAFTVGGYASGVSSVAIGFGSEAKRDYEVGLGKYNYSSLDISSPSKETSFSIGDGTSSSSRSNSFEIKKNSDIYVSGVGGYTGRNGGSTGIKTLQTVLNGKQDQLTAGTGISIQNNVISATGGSGQSYVAGNGIDITGNTISVDNTVATTSDLSGKQDTLVSGTNIKTVNGQNLLGAGNIIIYTEGDGITIDQLNNKISVDNFYLGDQYLSLTGGMLQGDSDSTTITSIEVVSPDSNVAGYILSQSEDTSDPDNPVPASVEIGLSGQPSGSTDATQGIYLRSNGTIAVNYLDSQGNSETAELEFPRKAPGQTYTIATLDDIQGGTSYTAGSGIDITGSTISVDASDLDGSGLNVDANGALEVDTTTIQEKLTAGSNISISGSTISATDTTYSAGSGLSLNGTTFSADTTVLATQNDLSAKQDTLVSGTNIKTINGTSLLGSGDITVSGGSSYQAGNGIGIQNDTISVQYDSTRGIGYDNSVGHNELFVQLGNGLQFDGNGAIETTGGSGSSYTAGTGISIDSSNVITNTAPGLWTSGTGTNSLLSPAAVASGTSTASQTGSISCGNYTRATGEYSTAFGQFSSASGGTTFAAGYQSAASGAKSVALGEKAQTFGQSSVALGNGAGAGNTNEVALGIFNKYIQTGTTAEKTQFTVGNGTGTSARSNLIEAKQNNDIYVYGVGGFDGTNAGTSGVQTLQAVIANAGSGGSGSYLPLSGGTLEGASTSTSLIVQAPQFESTANITLEALGTGSSSISLTTESSIPTDVEDFEINSNGSFTLNYVSGTNDTITLPKATGTIALQGDLAGNNNYTESAIVYSIGIGTSSNPLNALAVDSSGNIFIKGLGGYTGRSISGATSIQTLLSSSSNESNPSGPEITNQDDPGKGGWD